MADERAFSSGFSRTGPTESFREQEYPRNQGESAEQPERKGERKKHLDAEQNEENRENEMAHDG